MSVHKTDKKEFPNVHRQSCGSKKRKSVFDIQHWQVHVVLVAPGGLRRQALCLVFSHLWLVPCCSLWGVEHSGHQQYLSKGQRYRALTLLFQEVSFWVLFGKQLTPLASEVDWAAPYVWHSTIWTYAFLRSQVRCIRILTSGLWLEPYASLLACSSGQAVTGLRSGTSESRWREHLYLFSVNFVDLAWCWLSKPPWKYKLSKCVRVSHQPTSVME